MDYKGKKVLVTGADGFIGSHLTEALVRNGADVTALALYNSFDSHGWLDDLPDNIRGHLKSVRGDVRDSAFLNRIMRGQAVVFHLAALIAIPYSYAAAQSYVETNVMGTMNVLEAARQWDTERVVHTSTSEVYGTALTMPIKESHPLQGQSPYSASKIGADMMAEAYARSFDVPVVTLRPFNTYGPRQSERAIVPTIIRQALDKNCSAIMVGDTSPIRDLTFVEDTAAAFLTAGVAELKFGQAYNAGSQRAATIAEVLDLVVELSGSKKPVYRDESRLRPQNSEVRALLADSTQFEMQTGWRARTNLRDGLERTISWWRGRLSEGRVRREMGYMT
ncbi:MULTISPECIES: SDR family NAD(P)-dependent oxidoreductase [unclassified Mesorhizobium]|uniref:SDR family NAD(P)-dependent oxidoreductase n=1 Tax=unclassified Mesorhizobium TaxID=325217 RepID=UPI001CCFF596|nr:MULTISPECIES: SDR family NAD(P)-dependent oxidoreductase [unclassified Mesorhizobium]MBZ9733448.1 SDR family NAD(P)-dependent oxidoreductase [Mesorhizobium sp. CA9]MBZ9816212.1 SDR family NAD(P)-dependent oxidoreductase [Mesorhizobium sp. CA7]MBZ9824113.1 SDR family NAD(P)-dependent oxidoreductase [Mesorhizobium sp. CA18]MBZ9831401.1 SDR family NAD(P)-dependent oxidoreductase [Mesorhizobium sp. CA2]MBZ9837565.1 SDR family NAD(P)-dependent oxidoreductase [Mesorhizobium sp. CA3]